MDIKIIILFFVFPVIFSLHLPSICFAIGKHPMLPDYVKLSNQQDFPCLLL